MKDFRVFGQCKSNSGNKLQDVQGYGPMSLVLRQWDDVDFLVAALIKDANGRFTTLMPASIKGVAQETSQSGDTLYNGDGATLVFSHTVAGAGDLGNLFAEPVVPGTLTVIDAGSVAPNLQDIYGDGNLYTIDSDLELAGTIDYEDGYLNLAYPAGKAPGTGVTAINATFYSGTWLTAYGDRMLDFGGQPVRDQVIRLIGMSKKTSLKACRIVADAIFGW